MSLNKQPQPVQTPHGASSASHDGGVTVTPAKPGKLLRLPAVEERTGLKKSTIYAGVKAGTFPSPVRLSARAVAFREESIDSWISGRVTTGSQS
ncbi:prophage CP4-57 regulatory protein (AlpA) [mine drainage metagenome]|uniref:Prophage CP4-57 regulatory protein (AlpA) n=1 Tax=mine drainage metagenome TaxID=410659 RepID=A0A1J5Q8W0_9ZZZZ